MRFSNNPLLDKRCMTLFVYVVPLFLIRTYKSPFLVALHKAKQYAYIHITYVCMYIRMYVCMCHGVGAKVGWIKEYHRLTFTM